MGVLRNVENNKKTMDSHNIAHQPRATIVKLQVAYGETNDNLKTKIDRASNYPFLSCN